MRMASIRRRGVFTAFLGSAILLLAGSSSRGQGVDPRELVDQINADSYRHFLDDRLYAHDGQARTPFSPFHDQARQNIFDDLAGFGLDVRLDPVVWQNNTFYNVVGVQPGVVYPERIYIVAGHYDSVNVPGADDNASACAAVLEIARVFSRYQFESTILYIAFDIEEPGLVGSRDYAERHRQDDIRGVVVMDLIAYDRGTSGCVIYGQNASLPIKQALADAVTRYSGGLAAEIRGPLNRSDHAPFETVGKQACWLIEKEGLELNPCYHRACDSVDTPGYINYEYAAQLTRAAAGYLAEHAVVMDPSRCTDIRRFVTRCKQRTLAALLTYRNGRHDGEIVEVRFGGDIIRTGRVWGRKARMYSCCHYGAWEVELTQPPACLEPRQLDCGG